ncbi:MAG: EAL domain-containing protein [Hyphomicrobiaceae bacterium]
MSHAEHDETFKAPPPVARRRGDILIVLSMAIVAVAFGAGLLVHGGFGFGPSLIGGLSLFVLSMFLHTMMRRLDKVAPEVEAETAQGFDVDAPAATQGDPDTAARGDDHGWGEPQAVNDLVRQLATELKRSPESAPVPPPLPKAAPRAEAARPMPAPARPLASELPPVAAERVNARPAPPPQRPVAQPVAPVAPVAREGLDAVLARAVETEDVEIHLQPVMTLADRRTHLYEAHPRVRDGRGGLIRPEVYGRVAFETGLAAGIERVAFRRTVQILSRLIERGKQRPMFTAISAETLRDGTFLRAIHETLKSGPMLPANLILEMPEASLAALGPAERDAVHALASAGFRFALQDVLQLDMQALGDLPIAFVKLAPAVLKGQPGAAAGLVARVRSIGAEPVVDGVAEDHDIAVAQALGIVLGQGSLLSEPRPLKADVVGDIRTGT